MIDVPQSLGILPPSVPVKPGWPWSGLVLPSAVVASSDGSLNTYAVAGTTVNAPPLTLR